MWKTLIWNGQAWAVLHTTGLWPADSYLGVGGGLPAEPDRSSVKGEVTGLP